MDSPYLREKEKEKMKNFLIGFFTKRELSVEDYNDVRSTIVSDSRGPSLADLEAAYDTDPIVYNCITEIAKQIGAADIEAPLEISALLEQPNGEQSWTQFIQIVLASYYCTGCAYILKDRTGGTVQELKHLPTSLVTMSNNNSYINYKDVRYRFQELNIPRNDLIIIREASLKGINRIKSPLRSAWADVLIYREKRNYQRKMLEKLPKLVNVVELDVVTQKTQRLQLGDSIDNIIGVDEKSTVVLPQGAHLKTPGILTDPSLDVIGQVAEANLCGIFNVAPILVGCYTGIKSSTYANYETARKSLYTETILPLCSFLSQIFSKDLGVPVEIVPQELDSEQTGMIDGNSTEDPALKEKQNLKLME
jgi:HK97 family phage portal protein